MRHLLLCLTLAATPALAKDFEGVITGKPVSERTKGGGLVSLTMSLSPAGARVEATISMGGQKGEGEMHTIMVWRVGDPNTSYILNPATKTYLKQDVSKAREAASGAEAPTVEKLGTTTFLGHSVERVRVAMGGKSPKEYWVDTSLHFPSAALAAFGMDKNAKNGAWTAMEKAGVFGIPLKELNADGTSGWEASSVEQKRLSASLFEVPADYHESKNGGLDMLPPAQRAAMEERLNNMTPEQRAKMEEAMKNMTK
jgi:Domain of unknown function (DUF4412)